MDENLDNFYIRRVQRRHNGSLFISIPARIIHNLGWKAGDTIRFYEHNGGILLVKVKSTITKKDLKSIDQFLEGLDEKERSEIDYGHVDHDKD